LFGKQKVPELVLLYRSKEMHREALQLLAKYGTAKNNALSGPVETINYLKTLGKNHLQLILEFSQWVLRLNPELALEVSLFFTIYLFSLLYFYVLLYYSSFLFIVLFVFIFSFVYFNIINYCFYLYCLNRYLRNQGEKKVWLLEL
jgi:hypothetical protein